MAELLHPAGKAGSRRERRKSGAAGGEDDDDDSGSSDDDSFYNRAASKNSRGKDQPRTYDTLNVRFETACVLCTSIQELACDLHAKN